MFVIMVMEVIAICPFIPASLPYKNLDFPYSAASTKSLFCDCSLDLNSDRASR